METSFKSPGTGFLGSTSFSAVFSEGRRLSYQDSTFRSDALDDETALSQTIRPGRIEEGAEVLQVLINTPRYAPLIQEWHEEVYGLCLFSPWVEACVKTVIEELYEVIAKAGRECEKSILLRLSELIFRNNLKPLTCANGNSSFDEFLASFNGPNLRWETVGIFLTALGLSATETSSRDLILAGGAEARWRSALARQMLDLGQTCLRFCGEFGHLTDPEIWMISEHARFTSVIEGDAHYLTWQRSGNLISAIYAKGLHMEIKVSAEVPFWLAEVRKQAFGAAYCLDESLAAFTGRPPRLSRRYCVMQLPLGLELKALRLQGKDLEEVVNRLDSDGWDPDHSLQAPTWTRASLISNMVREDILELSLGTIPHADIHYAHQLSERLDAAWLSIPEPIRLLSRIIRSDRREWAVVVFIYLDYLYNQFILQRTMIKKFQTSPQRLMDLGQELISLVLTTMKNAASLGRFAADVPWVLAKYGLTSAGPLALELLRRSQVAPRPDVDPVLSRSEVVQNLSQLVAYLKSMVRKEDGNYTICFQARLMIQRILDQVLESEAFGGPPSFLPGAMDTPENDDMPWVGAAQSELDFWMSLSQHPLLSAPRAA